MEERKFLKLIEGAINHILPKIDYHKQDEEDIKQEIACLVIDYYNRYSDKEYFTIPYLYSKVLASIKKSLNQKRVKIDLSSLSARDAQRMYEDAMRKEIERALFEDYIRNIAKGHMRPTLYRVMVLRHDGYTFTEIGNMIDKSRGYTAELHSMAVDRMNRLLLMKCHRDEIIILNELIELLE